MIFDFSTGVIPDVLWVSDERLPAITIDPETSEQNGQPREAPDLVVEILSPGRANEERDRETKPALFSRRGVKEYWLVDDGARTVEVYRRSGEAGLELVATLTIADTLTSPLLPGFALAVERIIRLPRALQP